MRENLLKHMIFNSVLSYLVKNGKQSSFVKRSDDQSLDLDLDYYTTISPTSQSLLTNKLPHPQFDLSDSITRYSPSYDLDRYQSMIDNLGIESDFSSKRDLIQRLQNLGGVSGSTVDKGLIRDVSLSDSFGNDIGKLREPIPKEQPKQELPFSLEDIMSVRTIEDYSKRVRWLTRPTVRESFYTQPQLNKASIDFREWKQKFVPEGYPVLSDQHREYLRRYYLLSLYERNKALERLPWFREGYRGVGDYAEREALRFVGDHLYDLIMFSVLWAHRKGDLARLGIRLDDATLATLYKSYLDFKRTMEVDSELSFAASLFAQEVLSEALHNLMKRRFRRFFNNPPTEDYYDPNNPRVLQQSIDSFLAELAGSYITSLSSVLGDQWNDLKKLRDRYGFSTLRDQKPGEEHLLPENYFLSLKNLQRAAHGQDMGYIPNLKGQAFSFQELFTMLGVISNFLGLPMARVLVPDYILAEIEPFIKSESVKEAGRYLRELMLLSDIPFHTDLIRRTPHTINSLKNFNPEVLREIEGNDDFFSKLIREPRHDISKIRPPSQEAKAFGDYVRELRLSAMALMSLKSFQYDLSEDPRVMYLSTIYGRKGRELMFEIMPFEQTLKFRDMQSLAHFTIYFLDTVIAKFIDEYYMDPKLSYRYRLKYSLTEQDVRNLLRNYRNLRSEMITNQNLAFLVFADLTEPIISALKANLGPILDMKLRPWVNRLEKVIDDVSRSVIDRLLIGNTSGSRFKYEDSFGYRQALLDGQFNKLRERITAAFRNRERPEYIVNSIINWDRAFDQIKNLVVEEVWNNDKALRRKLLEEFNNDEQKAKQKLKENISQHTSFSDSYTTIGLFTTFLLISFSPAVALDLISKPELVPERPIYLESAAPSALKHRIKTLEIIGSLTLPET